MQASPCSGPTPLALEHCPALHSAQALRHALSHAAGASPAGVGPVVASPDAWLRSPPRHKSATLPAVVHILAAALAAAVGARAQLHALTDAAQPLAACPAAVATEAAATVGNLPVVAAAAAAGQHRPAVAVDSQPAVAAGCAATSPLVLHQQCRLCEVQWRLGKLPGGAVHVAQAPRLAAAAWQLLPHPLKGPTRNLSPR